MVSFSNMTKYQSEEISKDELPNFLSNCNSLKLYAFFSPEVFFEGDTFDCKLLQACVCMRVCLKPLFSYRHNLSIKDANKLTLTEVVISENNLNFLACSGSFIPSLQETFLRGRVRNNWAKTKYISKRNENIFPQINWYTNAIVVLFIITKGVNNSNTH